MVAVLCMEWIDIYGLKNTVAAEVERKEAIVNSKKKEGWWQLTAKKKEEESEKEEEEATPTTLDSYFVKTDNPNYK